MSMTFGQARVECGASLEKIGRAGWLDLCLGRIEHRDLPARPHSSQRFYSMSAQISQERSAYHRILEKTQKGTMDVTPWMEWFRGCLGRAIAQAPATLNSVLATARFWQAIAGVSLNERQRLVLNRLLDGFEGKLTTSKYAALTRCSQDMALRDIQSLLERGILVRNPAGGAQYGLRPCCQVADGHIRPFGAAQWFGG